MHIGQQAYEGIAAQNNISNIAHIVGAIIGYGLNVKAKYGLYRYATLSQCEMKDGVNVKKIIILLLCLVLVSCGTTNKQKYN